MIRVWKGKKVLFETELDLNKAVLILIEETKVSENNNEVDPIILIIGNSVYTYNTELQEMYISKYSVSIENMLEKIADTLMKIEEEIKKEEGDEWDYD